MELFTSFACSCLLLCDMSAVIALFCPVIVFLGTRRPPFIYPPIANAHQIISTAGVTSTAAKNVLARFWWTHCAFSLRYGLIKTCSIIGRSLSIRFPRSYLS